MPREMKSPQSNPGLPSAPRTEQRETPAEVYLDLCTGAIHTEKDGHVTEVSAVADHNVFILTETTQAFPNSWGEDIVKPVRPGDRREHIDPRVGRGSYEATVAGMEAGEGGKSLTTEREKSTRGSRN